MHETLDSRSTIFVAFLQCRARADVRDAARLPAQLMKKFVKHDTPLSRRRNGI